MDKNLKFQSLHFIFFTILICISVYFQSIFLARINTAWLHIDLVSIIVIYICVKHSFFMSLAQSLVAALLMQANSLITNNFYVIYFLTAIIIAQAFSKLLFLHKTQNQVLPFVSIFIFKYTLLFYTLNLKVSFAEVTFIVFIWKEFISTCVAASLIFYFLKKIDFLIITSKSPHKILISN